MAYEPLLIQFGLPLLFVGAAFAGDVFLLAAGFLAYQGYFNVWAAIGVGAAGSYLAQSVVYYLGYAHGHAQLARRPHWQASVARVLPLLHRAGDGLVAVFRFLFGLRSATAFAIGLTRYSPARFVIANAVGALLWAGVLTWIGYGSGHALAVVQAQLERYELALAAGLLLAAAGGWLVYRWRRRGPRPPAA